MKAYCKECKFYMGIPMYLEPDLSLAECRIPRVKSKPMTWYEKNGEPLILQGPDTYFCAVQNASNDCKLYVPKKSPQKKHKNRKPFMEFLRGGM